LTNKPERCLTCHYGLEQISDAHPVEAFGCVICHGGNRLGLTPERAHQGLLGGRNPSDFRVINLTCGRTGCHRGRKHAYQNVVDRSRRSLMATMAGVILGLRLSWGAQPDARARYASVGVADPTPDDRRPAHTYGFLATIPVYSARGLPRHRGRLRLVDKGGRQLTVSGRVADDQWRKFCARCHLNNERRTGPSAHAAGCAACHVLRAKDNRYHGHDPMIDRRTQGHGAMHRLTTAVPSTQCLRCHNRSGRIGLAYMGRFDADGYGTPFQRGTMNFQRLSDGRYYLNLAPDVHHQQGMHCIDCHTSEDLMGDGRIYGRMRRAVKIRCQTCHGGYQLRPRLGVAEDREFRWKVSSLKSMKLEPGDRPVLDNGGKPLSNVFQRGKKIVLVSKVTGKVHPVTVITGKRGLHAIRGHAEDNLECFACHARWAAQCYGCHPVRRQGQKMPDSMTGRRYDGRWSEVRDYYRFRDPPLGRNARGKVSPFMPGCQVLFTHLDARGRPIRRHHLFRGPVFRNGAVSTPINPHTTSTSVRSCAGCHLSPKALGLGQGFLSLGRRWSENRFLPLVDPGKSGNPLGFAWESLVTATGRTLMGTTHPRARPLNAAELRRMLRVGSCLPCHDRYDDPIYKNWPKSLDLAGTEKHRQLIQKSWGRRPLGFRGPR
ncbi:MAG: hypothetical protein KKC37_08895, partial [Proteobacteria bacterium]|nr:hypothetical protein [Pseudomonadota bacterium]